MNKHPGVALFSFVDLNKKSPVPLFQQLNAQIRQAVLTGRLSSQMRLPSSRDLARELGVSRTTIITAFEQLVAEGYLESRVGSGTYVIDNLTENIGELPPIIDYPEKDRSHFSNTLSRRGALLAKSISYSPPDFPASFLPNQPAYDQFPFALWSRLVARQNRNPPHDTLNYAHAFGYPPLRRAIANHLRHARGIICDENQIIVVTGTQTAMTLSAWILLDPGDAVLVEDPSLLSLGDMLVGFGGRIIHTPVDKNGMNVSVGIAREPSARMAIVAPSHQYPLGVTLSLSRRLELLAWANQARSWIIEDDYDGEFRFSGAPLAPLQTIDQNGRVIYVGTFSKVLFPSLRIGYLVVPPDLVDPYCAAVHLLNRSANTLTQVALAEFIDNGHFTTHIRKMGLIYGERHEAMLAATHKELNGLLDVAPAQAGMNVIGWLRQGEDIAVARQLKTLGILSSPMSIQFNARKPRQGLLLGFGCTPADDIAAAVKKMAAVLDP